MTRVNEILPQAPEPAWDWYSATLAPEVAGEDVRAQLGMVLGGVWEGGRPAGGYAIRADLKHGERTVLRLMHGGSQQRPLIDATGGDAVRVVPVIRHLWPDHRVTRADSAMDWDSPEAWDALSGASIALARERGLKTSVVGDYLSPGAPAGRTLYVGGRASQVRVRVYEKGKQEPSAGRPDWTRVELQVRPQKAGKAVLATLDPAGAWGTASWAGELSERLTGLPVARAQLGGYVRPDQARTREYLITQFARIWEGWSAEYGGDWATWGLAFGAEVESVRERL